MDGDVMKNYEGKYLGLVNEGTIIGASVEMTDGKTRTFWGDHRPMLAAFDGRKLNERVLIHYNGETDWTVEFPEDG